MNILIESIFILCHKKIHTEPISPVKIEIFGCFHELDWPLEIAWLALPISVCKAWGQSPEWYAAQGGGEHEPDSGKAHCQELYQG